MNTVGTSDIIRRFHRRPGQTVLSLAHWREETGASSYEWLLMRAGSPCGLLLDLACGDGYLTELASRLGWSTTGVDAQPAEVEAARQRLGPEQDLRCERAEALSLDDGSVDVVVCHLALMLMPRLDVVLAELSRVVKPGGRVLAVVNRFHPDPAYQIFSRELCELNQKLGLEPLKMGDSRLFKRNSLNSLLHATGFTELNAVDFQIGTNAAPADLWPTFERMYDVFRLCEDARVELREKVLSKWLAMSNSQNQVTCAMGMRLIETTRVNENET